MRPSADSSDGADWFVSFRRMIILSVADLGPAANLLFLPYSGRFYCKTDTQPYLTAHQLAQQRRSWAEQRTAAPAARQEK